MVKKFGCPDVKDNYGIRKMIKKNNNKKTTTYVLFVFLSKTILMHSIRNAYNIRCKFAKGCLEVKNNVTIFTVITLSIWANRPKQTV